MQYQTTLNLLNQYPHQIIIFRNKLYSKEEMIETVENLNPNVNPQELLHSMEDALYKTSNWKGETPNPTQDFEKALNDLL